MFGDVISRENSFNDCFKKREVNVACYNDATIGDKLILKSNRHTDKFIFNDMSSLDTIRKKIVKKLNAENLITIDNVIECLRPMNIGNEDVLNYIKEELMGYVQVFF